MGFGSHRKKEVHEFVDTRWEHISLLDFKARGCGPGFAYFWLWLMLIVSVAVYGLDSFTAVNLLIFDQWSSKIEPGIPLDVSKWIFSACILLSFVNLAFEAVRAYRVMRRGNVAECYLDPLAVRWESIRLGSGQGWKRFLVFAELTKSKKGAEYVALFTYFSLKAWIRILICSGPRQVINGFTFVSVYQSKLAVSSSRVDTSLALFFEKIAALAEEDYQQALVLGAMAFTFVVWVFSVLFFIAAILFYATFLCHWIPKSDGGLSGYCARKINQALKKIVTQKVNKALAKGEQKAWREELKAAKQNGLMLPPDRQATLPTLPNVGPAPGPAPGPKGGKEDFLPEMPMLNRNETMTTLPAYSSRPASPRGIEMDMMGQKRPAPSRSGTMASTATGGSYSSQAPLLGSAAEMGNARPASPAAPAVPPINYANIPPAGRGPPVSQRNGPPSGRGHMMTNSNSSLRSQGIASPAPSRSLTPQFDNYNQRQPSYNAYAPDRYASPAPSAPTPRQFEAYNPDRPSPAPSPAPSANTYHGGPMNSPNNYGNMRSATGPVPYRGPQQAPQRNMTAPMPPRGPPGSPFDRSGTPQGSRGPPPQDYRSGTPQGRGGPYGYGR